MIKHVMRVIGSYMVQPMQINDKDVNNTSYNQMTLLFMTYIIPKWSNLFLNLNIWKFTKSAMWQVSSRPKLKFWLSILDYII
jgi:hypothetical protein